MAELTNGSTPLFQQLDEYPWDQDQEFQGGLHAILGSVQDPDQVEHLTLRAKCYYYARKAGTPVDFEGYKQWRQHTTSPAATSSANAAPQSETAGSGSGSSGGGMADAPKPASFADICDMIAEGKPIPGIKDIPDTILEGQASDSQTSKRKKPWEKGGTTQQPSWMT